MADAAKPKLTFNGKDISIEEATKKLVEIYGEKRAPEIITGLADGTHRCASVAGGHIEVVKPAAVPETPAAKVETPS